MFLYLLQHGEAVPETIDPERPLAPSGRADIERLGDFLAGAGVHVARILHSGKLRARMSAEILAGKLGTSPGAERAERLLPGDSPEWLADAASSWTEDTLLVGHQPFMGRLVSRLVLGRDSPSMVDYVHGTMVCLLRRPVTGAWRIAWMVSPSLLRR